MICGRCSVAVVALLLLVSVAVAAPAPPPTTQQRVDSLRRAIVDIQQAHGSKYAADAYLKKLDQFDVKSKDFAAQFESLQREALLANPLIDFDRVLLIKRGDAKKELGLPANWQGNSSISRDGYDNELVSLSLKDGKLTSIYRPEKGRFIGDVDLHWDGTRALVSMPDAKNRWQVWEMKLDGSAPVALTSGTDYDSSDACYLPDGKIVFCSTACMQGVPCVGGGDHVALLYLLDPKDGSIRQLTFDQDHSWNPTVLSDGRVMYLRWEYSDSPHYFTRILMQMNPDGTGQMERYGSNSYWPNSVFYARAIPGHASKFAGIVTGHHGTRRAGELVVFDPAAGQRNAEGAVQRIYDSRPVEPKIRDALVDSSWPKFLHPYPLSEKQLLVSAQMGNGQPWGLYLADAFDNLVLIRQEPGYALFEPVALKKTAMPPVIPDKVNLERKDATVYIADIYTGPGLAGVPRGTVKSLRVFSPHYAYSGMGGHTNIGIDGPWDAKRILGTVKVEEDGSAFFKIPANTPIAVQPLDEQGRAVQLMRSWMTAMPGEAMSCVGCHEDQRQTAMPKLTMAQAAAPRKIEPWLGEARGFSFKREVQPVVDKYCVSCHDGAARDGKTAMDLRLPEKQRDRFTPAYVALHPYVRRPGPESDYHILRPMEYHADTSELVQMLKKGHYGVTLDREAWERLYTWIDLNVPDLGAWHEERKIPGAHDEIRRKYAKLFAGIDLDPELLPELSARVESVKPAPVMRPTAKQWALAGFPFDGATAKEMQKKLGKYERSIQLANGLKLDLVLIPAGEFVMGSADGALDESPQHVVKIDRPFWMSKTEITNAQYALFDPSHDSRYISKFGKDQSEPGYQANRPSQPVIRVTWDEAVRFTQWLAQQSGETIALPTEAQWEWACRGGSSAPFWYGDANADFSKLANLADASLAKFSPASKREGGTWMLKDTRFDDGQIVSNEVGRTKPNAFGLTDMHGNVAEWTRSIEMPYPYRDDQRNSMTASGRRVVRGGSWYDRPQRATASFRLSYPQWQKVYNVGIRVIVETSGQVARSQ